MFVLISIDKLVGKNVIGAKGYNMGEVKGFEFDPVDWKVTHMQVKLSDKAADELGFKKRFRSSTVCMPISMVAAIGDVVTLNKSLIDISGDNSVTECKE